jgi:crotonobetainyl-CoA:carnitine CoA-transferase CaiB-like acyl-CoA transferase
MLLHGESREMGWAAGPPSETLAAGSGRVKIEPPRGDPMRHIYRALAGIELPSCPPFDLDNRGKRSVVLDLAKPEGRELAHELICGADVVVTNYRHDALERLGLDWP